MADLDSDGTLIDTYVRGINLISSTNNGYYLFNAHGDVTQLAGATGAITKDYHYDAFGVEVAPDEADANPFRYCGEYFDQETGSIYLRARYYNPSTGRFMSEDPIQDGLNWYTYCGNNPIDFIDPTGEAAKEVVQQAKYSYADIWGYVRTFTAVAGMYKVGGIVVIGGGYFTIVGILLIPIVQTALGNPPDYKVTDKEVYRNEADPVGNRHGDTKSQIEVGKAAESVWNSFIAAEGYRTAQDIISKEKKGSINREFPKEWLDKTLDEIEKAAKRGDKSAQKAKKMLQDHDFDKDSNSTRSKKGQ